MEVIVITKHNKPVARLTPITDAPKDVFACMKNTVTIKSNIIDPIDALVKPYLRAMFISAQFLAGKSPCACPNHPG
jgi:antitoxin (DNA-binding transcriptional repressor) of toxin-antitoxin stability system